MTQRTILQFFLAETSLYNVILPKSSNLCISGDLDVSTVLFMKKPRCGNRDRKTPVRASTDTKDKTSTPEDYDVIVPAVANNGSQSEEHQLTRRKRWDIIDGSAFWTSAFGFEMPITVGFLDYSSKMSQADQDAALVHCLTVSTITVMF